MTLQVRVYILSTARRFSLSKLIILGRHLVCPYEKTNGNNIAVDPMLTLFANLSS